MKKTKINIPIMYCFDTNYVIPAAAAFYSLLEHASKEYDYTFYVLHSDITEYQQNELNETIKEFDNCKIEFIDMNHRLDDFWSNNYKGGHFSKEVMYKLLVASIFPDLDKIIVSDVDVIFLGDISDSYFELTDKDDAYIAGVKPIGKVANYLDNYYPEWTREEISKLGNICGGYLVMNLKKIRENDLEKVFLKSLEENGSRLNQMEQDIFNITCYGKIKHLHLKYVACSYMWDYYKTDQDKETDINYSKKEIEEAMEHPVQLHYATSTKPWKNVDCTLSAVWFSYIVKTPFAQEYFDSLPNRIVLPDSRNKEVVYVNDGASRESLYRRLVNRIPRPIKTLIKHPTVAFKRQNRKRVTRKLFKKKYSYIIFDDIFPSDLSPFRYTEFMEYSLDNYNTYFAITGRSLTYLKVKKKLKDIVEEFQVKNPHFYGRIFDVSENNRKDGLAQLRNIKNPFAVFVFEQNLINEVYDNLAFLEDNNIPFMITLYPGGGLVIDDKTSDDNLKRIFESKCFRKVIVTQDNVKDYLLKKKLCKEEDIEFIFGIVTPESTLKSTSRKRLYYPDKKHLDICFVAHKYLDKGSDKGYDLFIESAKKIVLDKKIKNARFHVVGEFNKEDIDVSDIEKKIHFYGVLPVDELNDFYQKMDIIVSPTRPFVLSKGSFDGFPTGSVTNAMLNGVLAITTDSLKLNNNRFEVNKDIIIVEPKVDDIVSKIDELYKEPDKMVEIATSGKNKAKDIYSLKNQIDRRTKLLKSLAKREYK